MTAFSFSSPDPANVLDIFVQLANMLHDDHSSNSLILYLLNPQHKVGQRRGHNHGSLLLAATSRNKKTGMNSMKKISDDLTIHRRPVRFSNRSPVLYLSLSLLQELDHSKVSNSSIRSREFDNLF